MFDRNIEHLDTDIIEELQNTSSPSTEIIMPFQRIENGIVYVNDNSKIVVLTFPGKDTSIMEDEAKEEYADDTSKVLAGITGEEFAIQWIPEKINSEANLNLCRRRLDEMQKVYYNAKTSSELKKPLFKRIQMLQDHVLPKIQNQATSSKSIQGNTYLWIKYRVRSEIEIKNDITALLKRIDNVTGRQSEWIQSKELVLNLLENWISNSVPLTYRKYETGVIMPDYMAKRRRK